MWTVWTFYGMKNKQDVYRGENWMKTFCESIREHVKKTINFEKKKMVPLTSQEYKSYLKQTVMSTTLKISALLIKIIVKLRTIVIIQVNIKVQLIIYEAPKEVPVVFHHRHNYHFIMKELAKEFEGEFNCLGENTEKYKTFSVPIEKEVTRIAKNGNEIKKTISCK